VAEHGRQTCGAQNTGAREGSLRLWETLRELPSEGLVSRSLPVGEEVARCRSRVREVEADPGFGAGEAAGTTRWHLKQLFKFPLGGKDSHSLLASC